MANKLDDDVEAFIRMVDDEILGPNGFEAIAVEFANPLRETRVIGLELEVGPLHLGQLRKIDHAQQPVMHHHIGRIRVQPRRDDRPEFVGNIGVDGEPDDRALQAPFERRLIGPDKVFGFFVELYFGVAQDAKPGTLADVEIGKQPADEHRNEIVLQDEAYVVARQLDETLEHLRQDDQRLQVLAIAGPAQLEHHRQAKIPDKRKRMGGIKRQGRQQGKDLFHEPRSEPGAIVIGQFIRRQYGDSSRPQLPA